MRYLEESKTSFEAQHIDDQEYFQCATLLGHVYLDYYLQDRPSRVAYLRRARTISRMLVDNWDYLGRAKSFAAQLRDQLRAYGSF